MSKVIFSITDVQAAALRGIQAGIVPDMKYRGRNCVQVLMDRGLVAIRLNAHVVTPQGQAVIALVDALAQREWHS